MSAFLFPDTTVLINFAVIGELTILKAYLADRGRAVEAVVYEIKRSTERTINLSQVDCGEWFGKPIRVNKASDIEEVRRIRTGRFGGRQGEPLKHLGESQTIHVVSSFADYHGSWVLTDDGAAYTLSKARGIATRHTVDILRELVSLGTISNETAYRHAESMMDNERTLLEPPSSARDFS